MTNYEKITNMSIDEMTEYLNCLSGCKCCVGADLESCGKYPCETNIKKWLESEITEE